MIYKKQRTIENDIRYGNCIILENKQDKRDVKMQKNVPFINEEDLAKKVLIIKKLMKDRENNIQAPLNFEIDEKAKKIKLFFDYLEDFIEIENIVISEVIILFKDVLKALLTLKKHGLFHGSVNKEYISFHTRYFKYFLLEGLEGNKNFSKQAILDNFKTNENFLISPFFFESIIKKNSLDKLISSEDSNYLKNYEKRHILNSSNISDKKFDFEKEQYETAIDKINQKEKNEKNGKDKKENSENDQLYVLDKSSPENIYILNDLVCLGFFCLNFYVKFNKIKELYDLKKNKFNKIKFYELLNQINSSNEGLLQKVFFNYLISFILKTQKTELNIEEAFVALKFIEEFENLFEYDLDLQKNEKEKFIINSKSFLNMKNNNADFFLKIKKKLEEKKLKNKNIRNRQKSKNMKEIQEELNAKRLKHFKYETTFENKNIKNMMIETAQIIKEIKKQNTEEINLENLKLKKRIADKKILNNINKMETLRDKIMIKIEKIKEKKISQSLFLPTNKDTNSNSLLLTNNSLFISNNKNNIQKIDTQADKNIFSNKNYTSLSENKQFLDSKNDSTSFSNLNLTHQLPDHKTQINYNFSKKIPNEEDNKRNMQKFAFPGGFNNSNTLSNIKTNPGYPGQ
jgi:hypothetical protein